MTETTRVLVLGATSAIAERWSRLRAASGDRLLLVGRDGERLESIAADLGARGASWVETAASDLVDTEEADKQFDEWLARLGGLDLVLIAYGTLGDQETAQRETAALKDVIATNFSSVVVWSELAARTFAEKEAGALVAISSVAGDRGRRTNYAYGAAKSGVSTYLEGMAQRFAGTGVSVLCIKPGFVATPMTAHIEGRGGPLWATPEQIAGDIERALRAGRPVTYTPWFWRWIMLIIRHLPRFVFNRMKI